MYPDKKLKKVPQDLWIAARHAAMQAGLSVSDWIIALIRAAVEGAKQ